MNTVGKRCTCANVLITRWRSFRLLEPSCIIRVANNIYKPVTHSVLKVYNLFVKAQNRIANQLNKLWVKKVLNVPLPTFCFLYRFLWTFQFSLVHSFLCFLYILRGNPPDICCILSNNFPPKPRLPRRALAATPRACCHFSCRFWRSYNGRAKNCFY